MKVRLYDLFDENFTCGIYDDVEYYTDGTLHFSDGDEIDFDSQFVGVEEIDNEGSDGCPGI